MLFQQYQPTPWTCLATSFAMCFEIDIKTFLELIGHDGSAIEPRWSHLPEPYNRRGHHIQEFIMLGMKLGYHVIPFEPRPSAVSLDPNIQVAVLGDERWQADFASILKTHQGVLTGRITETGSYHAVAKDYGDCVFDPSPQRRVNGLDDFDIECFWCVIKSDLVFGENLG